MLNILAAKFARLPGLIRSTFSDPKVEIFGAALVILTALVWELIKALITHPDIFVFAPIAAICVLLLLTVLFVMGALGWFIYLLTVAFVRWRIAEETKSKGAWPAIVLAVAGLVIVGIPEISEKLAWWQENVFRYLPHETEILKNCHRFIHSERYLIYGLMFITAWGCLIFWSVFRSFREKVRDALAFFKNLTTGRSWRWQAAVLAGLTLATVAFTVYSPSNATFAVLFFELTAFLLWFFAPVIRANFRTIVTLAAWLVPAFMADERTETKGSNWGPLYLILWGVWLFSPMLLRVLWWRVVFWVGVLAFASYIALGPGSM